MKKGLSIVCIMLSLLLVLAACSKSSETSVQKTEEELKAEIKAEMEAELRAELETEAKQKEESVEDEDMNNKDNAQKSSKKLTDKQIEAIASDLVACFNIFDGDQILSIGPDEAEEFGNFLVFIKGQQQIVDNYVPNLESLLPSNKMEIKQGETMYGMGQIASGEYVELISEAVFDVDITPKEEYIWTPCDPAIVGSKLKEVKEESGKYIATLNILDEVEQPFLTMEIHLSVTNEGYTRIEYVSTKKQETNSSKPITEFTNKKNYPTSETVNGEDINYGDYYTVIIPMYQGIYSEVEEPPMPFDFKEYTLGEGQTMLHFAVFGEFNLEGFTVVNNMQDEGTFYPIGETIKDSMINVYCDLPTDFSRVGVTGNISFNEKNYKVEFGLDDMRDISAYKILKYK